MLVATKSPWLSRLGVAAVAALAIGAVALPSAPAQAQVSPYGWGYYDAPSYYHPYYYPRAVAYHGCGWGWH